MKHRIFINFEGLSPPEWIHCYLEENCGTRGKRWWSQCITDTWENNTNCYYFEDELQAAQFEMIYKIRGEN